MVVTGMKFKLNRLTFTGGIALATAAAIGLSVPGVQSQTSARIVKIDGSSTVFPITEAVAEEFQKKNNAIKVTVGVSGTGGGFKKFCNGETDISNASRPIKDSEMAECKKKGISFIELPIAYDALTVVINPRNTWASSLTVADLKKMWEPAAQGKVTRWNQIKPEWPNAPLRLFGPGADSGTFDYFTEAVNGKSGKSRTDYTASEDDNLLVQGVSRDRDAIGYFGYAYYEANKNRIKAVSIVNEQGKSIPPTRVTVEKGTYTPLSRPLFIYVSSKALQRKEVQDFVSYYLNNAAKLSAEVKYVPLPKKAYDLAKGIYTRRRYGTVFSGDQAIGKTIEEIMQLESKG